MCLQYSAPGVFRARLKMSILALVQNMAVGDVEKNADEFFSFK
jgi:hypothetical protein